MFRKLENFSKTGSTFLTKRFDREGDRRIHFASAMTLLGKTDGMSASAGSSYMEIVSIIKTNSAKEYINLSKMEETRRLFVALSSVEKNRKPCYIREFSIEHFQDSKYFKQLKNQVAKIFRRFHPEYASMDTAEILAEYGIYHTPNYVYLKGDIMIMIDGQPMKLRTLN